MTRKELLKIAKPIIFCTEMVQAVQKGDKSVTRRVMVPQPPEGYNYFHGQFSLNEQAARRGRYISCLKNKIGKFVFGRGGYLGNFYSQRPRYNVGDIMYVRETWCELWDLDENDQCVEGTGKYYYRADGENPTPYNSFPDADGYNNDRCYPRWKPSIHMPKEAARIFLECTGVKVERVQDITEDQAMLEGVFYERAAEIGREFWVPTYYDPDSGGIPNYKGAFQELWNNINSSRGYGWDVNPWVLAYSFKPVLPDKEGE